MGAVIAEIPTELVDEIIVVNNASTDNTEKVANGAGATVLKESIPGYGRACLTGMEYIANSAVKPDIVVFIDADHSDYPEEMTILVEPIIKNKVDMVIGSRALGNKEKASMKPQQIFRNWLAT